MIKINDWNMLKVIKSQKIIADIISKVPRIFIIMFLVGL